MKTETAQQILAAARAEAQKMGKAVTIVVVDGVRRGDWRKDE